MAVSNLRLVDEPRSVRNPILLVGKGKLIISFLLRILGSEDLLSRANLEKSVHKHIFNPLKSGLKLGEEP